MNSIIYEIYLISSSWTTKNQNDLSLEIQNFQKLNVERPLL